MSIKSTRFWKSKRKIHSTTRNTDTCIIAVGDRTPIKWSKKLTNNMMMQLNDEDIISEFAQWNIMGSDSHVRELFRRTMPDGRDKVIRLHNTVTNVKSSAMATLQNLLTIGLYRSCMDPSSERRTTSPLHVVADGGFAMGYDAILIPSENGLIMCVNPTSNYTKWIDIAVVGTYKYPTDTTFIYDSLVHELCNLYGGNLMVRDHHPNDPGPFGSNTLVPIAVADWVTPMHSNSIQKALSDSDSMMDAIDGNLLYPVEVVRSVDVPFSDKELVSAQQIAYAGSKSGMTVDVVTKRSPVFSVINYLKAVDRELKKFL
jgi:hypothetical protein